MIKRHIVLLVLVLTTLLAFTGCREESDKAVLQTVDQLETRQPDAVWAATAPKAQEAYGEEGIKGRMEKIDHILGVSSIDYQDVRFNKQKSDKERRVYDAKAVLKTEYGEIERPLEMAFVPGKDGRWLADWTPALIVPGLKKDNDLLIKSAPTVRGKIFDRNGRVLAENKDGVRVYPYGVETAAVVGYVRALTGKEAATGAYPDVSVGTYVGRAGLEKVYQKRLGGKNGVRISFTDNDKDVLIKTNPTPGQDIHTTLDMQVQKAAFSEINGEYGAVVAMNPQNGQVLALVSSPTYDPALWLDGAMSSEDYAAAVANQEVPGDGLFAQKFTPGSTQKLFTSIVGLNDGVMTFDTYYNIYGSDWQPDHTWGGYRVHRVTPINGAIGLEQALISSDNIFFAMLGLNLGAEKLVSGLEGLGYQQNVPGDYPAQKSQIHSTGTLDPEHQTGIADTSYGQYQVQITPYQLCMTFGLLANGGNIMVPKLLLDQEKEVWLPQVTSQANIDFLNKALRKATAITHPTADRSYAEFTGKTGTAEVGPGGTVNLGWYAGYDQKNPDCTMVVMINHVENRGGSDYNTAVFGRIMDKLYINGQPYTPAAGTIEKKAEDKEQSASPKKKENERE